MFRSKWKILENKFKDSFFNKHKCLIVKLMKMALFYSNVSYNQRHHQIFLKCHAKVSKYAMQCWYWKKHYNRKKKRKEEQQKKGKRMEDEMEGYRVMRGKRKNMIIKALSTWMNRFRNHLASAFSVSHTKYIWNFSKIQALCL